MWHRRLLFLFGCLGLLYSSFSVALGLGEISLNSQYNEPLDAEIRLLKVRNLSEQEILVSLAEREDFLRAGVERPFFLSNLSFDVSLDNAKNPVIRVTSSKPVTEPYLNFLVEVQWPSGRLVREYTLLLDLPVFNDRPAASTSIAPQKSAAPAPSAPVVQSAPAPSAPVPSTPAPSAPVERTPAPVPSTPKDSYRVRSGDTLGAIAKNAGYDSSVSVNQAMVAIQRANPDAFINNNLNLIKKGKVLRIPNAAEAKELSRTEANQIVRQQVRDWSNRSQQQQALTTSGGSKLETPSSTQPEGRLTLGSADGGSSSVSGVGTSGAGAALESELAVAQEELDRTRRENSNLRSRIGDLEAEIETMEDLVKVTNERMRALEIALGTDGNATEEPDTAAIEPSIEPQPDVLVEDPDTATSFTGEEPVEPSVTQEPFTAADPEPVVTPEPVVIPEPEPTPEPIEVKPEPSPQSESLVASVIDFFKQNMIVILGGVAAFFILILLLLKLRNRPEKDDLDEFVMAEDDTDSIFEDDGVDSLDDDLLDESLDDVMADEEQPLVEAQTEDVVAEADIYISLGQQEKAVELLEREAQQNPDNIDAHLGLLKIHADNNDAAAFDAQYGKLLPLGNGYANDQATALRSNITDAAPFDTDALGSDAFSEEISEDLTDAADDLDLDLDLDLDGDQEEQAVDFSSDLTEESVDLDLELDDLDIDADLQSEDDLGLDLTVNDEGIQEDIAEAVSDEVEESTDLDLDLNFELPDISESGDDDLSIDQVEENLSDLDLDLNDLDMGELDDLESEAEEVLSAVPEVDTLDLDDELEEEAPIDSFSESVEANTQPTPVVDTSGLDLENSVILDSQDEESIDDITADVELDLGLDNDAEIITGDAELDLDLGEASEESLNILEEPEKTEIITELEASVGDLQEDIDDAEDLDDKTIPNLGLDLDLETEESSEESAFSGDLDLDLDDSGVDDLDLDLDLTEEEAPVELDAVPVEDDTPTELESPAAAAPIDDFDLDSLDREIDEMTADFDNLDMDSLDETTAADLVEDAPEASFPAESMATDEESPTIISSKPADISVPVIDEPEEISLDSLDDVDLSEDSDLDFLDETDEVATKLDLARAYLDMGDHEGAQDILSEVMEEGNEAQQSEAKILMEKL